MTQADASLVRQNWIRRLLGWLWYVHKPVILLIQASPMQCLQTLVNASRPNTQQLHHRNLFVSGRRYEIQTRGDGFRLRTTSKVSWHHRYRTRSAAVMNGLFYSMGDDLTRVQLETHFSIRELVEFTFIPTFMTSIILFVPWHPVMIAVLIVLLYCLSWIAHRYNAAFEANEMIFFVQKALEDLETAEIKTLHASSPDVIYDQFDDEWEKFYKRHNT